MTQKLKNQLFILVWILSMSLVLASCAPKKQGTRVTAKKAAVQLNPATSAVADQQAVSLNANYKIYSVGFPEASGFGYVVNSEIADPSQRYIPVTTTHENGLLDTEGTYTDSSRGLQIYVNARCSADGCSRYYLLVTAVRNNQAVYQNGAVSFKDDCSFYSISIGAGTSMYNSIENFANNWSHLQPMGDSSACYE